MTNLYSIAKFKKPEILSFCFFCIIFIFVSCSTHKKNFKRSEIVEPRLTVQPAYIEGEEALENYLKSNLKYPNDAFYYKMQGTVYVQFMVLKDGTAQNFEVVKGIEAGMDGEAIRLLKNVPKWKPGELKGEQVITFHRVPVKFEFPENK